MGMSQAVPADNFSMSNQHEPAAPAASLVLWGLGFIGFLASIGITVYGFAINCEESAGVTCSVNALILESMGLLGMFFAALLIVGGFAARTKHRDKIRDQRIQALEEDWDNRRQQ